MMTRLLLPMVVLFLFSVLGGATPGEAKGQANYRDRDKKAESKESEPTFESKARIDFDKEVTLKFLEAKRYRSMATLYFEVQLPRRYSLGQYDPHLKLVEGLGGAWLLRGTRATNWKSAKLRARSVIVTLDVREIHPDAKKLTKLKVILEVKKRGKGREPEFIEVNFKEVPI